MDRLADTQKNRPTVRSADRQALRTDSKIDEMDDSEKPRQKLLDEETRGSIERKLESEVD